MICPYCKTVELTPTMTKQGVEIDSCSRCKGIWLDRGEIFFFTKKVVVIAQMLSQAVNSGKPTTMLSPKTQKPMQEISLLDGRLHIDHCPDTDGLWFDGGELEQLQKANIKDLKIILDEQAKISAKPEEVFKDFKEGVDSTLDKEKKEKMAALSGGLTPLPNLFFHSCSVLLGLYALLIFALITCANFGLMTPEIAILTGIVVVFLQFIFSPWLMDLSLRFFYEMSWDANLPIDLSNFIRDVCRKQQMNFPRVGILHDGAPQAFTYGHHPNNARIVISQGLIDLLEPEEVQAVVAHEIGHAKHWDMLIMTIAYLVPLILYYIYRMLIRIHTTENKAAGAQHVIAMGSYILYIISQYIVLWFSRIREYSADRFSGQATKNPNALASALVKIAYGLAGQEKEKEEETRRTPALEAVGALGIFDPEAAKSLAIASYSSPANKMGGEINKENLQDAMKWDLWNPWAKYYELHSTHPLVANRLNYLSEQSAALGKKPFVVFNRKRPESYWDEFFIDLLIMWLPCLVLLAEMSVLMIGWIAPPYNFNLGIAIGSMLSLVGIAEIIKILFSYKHGYFPLMNIASLLKKVKVSAIRPIPCTLKGKIIGRGIPGLIWSEDFIMQDDTGIIFLDYRQPLGIWEFLFGLFRRATLQNQEVTLTGWYRRSPVPYVEIKNFTIGTTTRTCYVYYIKLIFAVFIMLIGIEILMVL